LESAFDILQLSGFDTSACCYFIISQAKQCNVAQFIFQTLQSLACIKPTAEQGQRTVQQVQALMERLENAVRKVLDSMRTTVGVGVSRRYPVVNQQSANCQASVDQQLADSRLTNGQQLDDRWPTVGQQTANKVSWEAFFTFANITIQVIRPTSVEQSIQAVN